MEIELELFIELIHFYRSNKASHKGENI